MRLMRSDIAAELSRELMYRMRQVRRLLHWIGRHQRIVHSTIFNVSVKVITPITFPVSLTKTHLENLTKGIKAFAGVDTSTIGGGGSITDAIDISLRFLLLLSAMVFASLSSLNIPTTIPSSKTGS